MRRYVYVVCFGDKDEGQDPQDVWASLDLALAEAQKRFGVRPTHIGGVAWAAMLNGRDQVLVRRFTVKGGAR